MKTPYKLALFLLVSIGFSAQLFADKTLNVIHYKQCGQTWSNMQIGTCGPNSMCNLGCAVCCVAMVSNANGTGATPASLATFLNANNLWAGDCIMDWVASLSYPGTTMQWGGAPGFSTAVVKQQIDANNPVIAFVLLPGSQTHFVVINAYVNNGTSVSDFRVLDPLKDNPTNLNTYDIQNLRLYNNVIQNSQMTFTLKINGELFPPSPNEYTIFKYPPIPQTYYQFKVEVANRNGNTYDIYLIIPNGDSMSIAQNVDLDVYTGYLAFDSTSSSFPNGGGYRIKIYKNDPSGTLWATSEPFFVCTIPRVRLEPVPGEIYVGESLTVHWYIEGGNIWKPNGGWTNNALIELYNGTTWVQVLGTPPVNSGSYTFTVPSHIGPTHRISISNPTNSSIPPGYVYNYSNNFTISNSIGIEQRSEVIPFTYKLYQNHPNPFNPTTKISFDIPKTGFTKIRVFDILGNELFNLINGQLIAGEYVIDFDGSNLSSGVYFYKLESNDFVKTNKMMLVK